MTSISLDFIRNSPLAEIGVKAVVGAGVMLGSCNTINRLGVKIFDRTGCTLMNCTPRFISRGIYQFFGQSLAPINQYFERKNPILGRVVVAPILEELVFRGAQVLILSSMMGVMYRIALSTIVFNFAHNEAQPGKNFVLLFLVF